MAPSQEFKQNPLSIFDESTLFCQEEKWEDYDDEDFDENNVKDEIFEEKNSFLLPILLLNQDLFIGDEELQSLFLKEKKQGKIMESSSSSNNCCLRKEAIEWIIKVNSYNGFCNLTCVLAINYLDRFFASFNFQNDKPWMFQLGAVACLSIAAKVEETYVPLLLDLQGEGAKYAFDAKTIQKMELLVLSTLEWKMNQVTPLSFLDHIIRRLGLKNHLHWEFLRRCEQLLLSLLSDWRFVSYLPSILATATMMHVIDQIEPCNPLDYQNQLLTVLNIGKDKVKDCYQLIVEKSSSCNKKSDDNNTNLKRTFDEMLMTMNNFLSPPTTTSFSDVTYPSSPSGVMDAYYLSSDSSNDAWVATTIIGTSSSLLLSSSSSSSLASSVTSSPVIPRKKKSRVHEQPMPLQLPSLSRVFAEVVGSPR